MFYSFSVSQGGCTFASEKNEQDKMKGLTSVSATTGQHPTPDWLFILWAGGTALLSYSLVYALRKPFTAAEFEGLQVWGMDYKIAVSMIQLLGYVCAKMLGIKFISELRPEGRLRFIIGSAALSEASLVAFGLCPLPYNVMALFFNGLSLGCMWGVIFSFLEGRRTTDILASIMGVSMALSSGLAKSLGLYALNELGVSEFWMPALIGAAAFPLLSVLGWVLTRLLRPTAADVASRSVRVTLNGQQRWALFRRYMPLLTLPTTYGHLRVLCVLLLLSMLGMGTLAFWGANFHTVQLPTTIWLFLQSLCLDVAYLSFQTIFFERFIACFKIRGNVGFFIITIDFMGYLGTLALLLFKELHATNVDWQSFYNHMSFWIGVTCCVAFAASLVYLIGAKRRQRRSEYAAVGAADASGHAPAAVHAENNTDNNNIYLTTKAI